MLATLRQRNFSLLWFGQLISLIGDWLLFIALPFYIYTLTGSALATGIMFIVQTLPRIFISSLAGVFVDRWSRKYTMLVTNLIQSVVLLPLLLVHSKEMLWIVYTFAFVEACVSQFFTPAANAIIPNLVDKEHLLAANSLNSMSQELTRLIGPFLGGVLMGLYGINSVVIIDVLSFLIAAGTIALITVQAMPRQEKSEPTRTVAGLARLWQEWLAGLQLVKQDRLICTIFLAFGASMIGEGLIQVILAPWVKDVLHGTALTFGWIATSQAIGGLLGSLLMPYVSKVIKPTHLIPMSGVLVGLLLLAIVNIPILAVDLVLVSLAGVAVIGFFVNLYTLLQASAVDAYRGRIFGAFGVVQALTMLLGMVLASSLGDRIGIVPVLDIAASCDLLAGLLALLVVRNLKQPAPEPEQAETNELLEETKEAIV
jgi:MFS family permease